MIRFLNIYSLKLSKAVVVTLFALVLVISDTVAQSSGIEKGFILNLGLGKLNSKNLNNAVATYKTTDPYLITSSAHANNGGLIGIGGWGRYTLNPKFSLLAELSLNYQGSKLFINYVRDSFDVTNSGIRHRISSEISIRSFYVNIPLLVRYKVFTNRLYYLLGGFTFNITPHPRIKSFEENVTATYLNNIIYSSQPSNVSQRAVLDKYNAFNVFFTLGLEKGFRKKMFFSLKWNLPLTASPMYTSNSEFYATSFNNKAFTSQGKLELEQKSKYSLKDFRKSFVVFSVNYRIGSKKS